MKTFLTSLLIIILSSPLFAAPSVTLQTSAVNNPSPLTFQVNVTFSEPVAGFFPADVIVTNGTVVSITGNSCQPNYVITIQPTTAGSVTVRIPANAAMSVTTGELNQASNLLTIPPAAAVDLSVILQTTTLSNPYPLPFQVNVTFSEAVAGFSSADVIVTNGTVANITGGSGQTNYTLTIQPAATGVVTATIPAGSVVSISSGTPNKASNLLTVSGLNPALRPASNFDLKTWSLTLPLPLGSKNNAISIGQATLNGTPGANNGYTNAPYFFTDPVSGAMNMFAAINGGTTPGSEYSRCEFYEVLPGASAYWKLNTFARNSLSASLLVSQVAPVQKRVIVGQIHDKGNTDSQGNTASNSPLLKLYYDRDTLDPNKNPCNGCIYAQIRTTPAQSSFLKIVNLVRNIPLNTIFTYNITLLRDGTLTITANNVSTTIKLSTSTNNTIGWGTQQLYFKAGVYNLEFGSSNTLGGAASFYSLQVAHT
ncbi:MAG: polysaccharide lyase family 7 protein [Legionellaceae bacterium]|nr:polysaccharide lyase family 7 protein [Legionellaceae bacterium]